MGKIGLLVLTNPLKITRLLPSICEHVRGTLYVQYLPLGCGKKLSYPQSLEDNVKILHYSSVINEVYSHTATLQDLDVRVLMHSLKHPESGNIRTKKPIEVVIFDQVFSKDEINRFVKDCVSTSTVDCNVVTNELNSTLLPSALNFESTEDFKTYDNVVLGGTFDGLHNGHKILLSEAVLRCNKRITVGVTDMAMIKSKVLWELIEPCSQRISSVEDFLQDVDPSLHYSVVPIDDPFGPTKEDPSFEMIVVSAETQRGGLKVNELRARLGLPRLDVHTVQLLETDRPAEEEEEKKLSSSNRRLRLLGTRLRTPPPRPDLPARPYVVGLTGGIASGKSSLSGHLRALGAGVVECDALAHGLYAPGRPLHGALAAAFGRGVLGPGGEVDRKALGAVVFRDQLARLNVLVWPELRTAARRRAEELSGAGHRVVVVEAAVLLQAGWEADCHEVWGCIVSPEEAVRRLRERDGLTEEEACRRLAAQPSNTEVVARSHVVFSPAWSVAFTRTQAQRAWAQLLREQPSLASPPPGGRTTTTQQ
ncbi:bifunctional coenzyme A synthase isoform X2 [Bacillus rossius redtenbacheri]|uniref:bifunctional coenzyme A synthase isoform X2 n=1 Tax=Bacillus rossius redtenbacheri TaxID=93214 RepID=UPI002FDC7CA8